MTAPQAWTADRLAGWVADRFGAAPAHQAWCEALLARGYAVAAYECAPSGAVLLVPVPAGYEADDMLPYADGGTVWPVTLAGVCYPAGTNVIPLPRAAGSGR